MDSEQETQAPVAAEGSKPSDDSASSTDNAQDYDGLTVAELKTKLKESGLPVSGKKSEHIARLVASNQEVEEVSEDKKIKKIELENLEELSRSELRGERKKYHILAEEIRVKRDELNLKSQTHAASRNELNLKAKEYMDSVHLYRDRRNGLNVEVGQIRDERHDVSDAVKVLKEKFLKLKRARFSGRNLPPIARLRKQIQELEIKQMTTPLTRDKERALGEEIGSLKNKIKELKEKTSLAS